MSIKEIKVTNFKSFKELNIELGNFNILIGANASGKSNLINIFKFLRDIKRSGLSNAISLQGGIEYLRNINIGTSRELSMKIVFDQEKETFYLRETTQGYIMVRVNKFIYEFSLMPEEYKFEITRDRLIQYCDFFEVEMENEKIKRKQKIGKGQIFIYRDNGKIKLELKNSEKISIEELFPGSFYNNIDLKPENLLLESRIFFILPPEVDKIFSDISIYDFEPGLTKAATPITGKADLEENGSNLAIVLKNILSNDEKRRTYTNLIKDLLPFVTDLNVEKFADKSLLFTLRETYSKEHYLPASLISDGTINITALIIALYFQKDGLTIIEEPERNIHPHLISRLVNMMKDASNNKQIIVTTHNPEIIKHADLKDIFLISRDRESFSNISKPFQRKAMKIFLANEMGIDDLYIQNLLEI